MNELNYSRFRDRGSDTMMTGLDFFRARVNFSELTKSIKHRHLRDTENGIPSNG
jgi:hypothetical protein